MYGAIEAGGTKFVCSVGNEANEILHQLTFPTTTPEETMAQVIEFFRPFEKELQAIGVGSFGPIDVIPNSDTYGFVTNTPKIAWRSYDFLGTMQKAFPTVSMAWTTDVNAAAYGEYVARKTESILVYFTVGTGIGGGAVQNGEFVQGLGHAEMGHMTVRQHPDDSFEGACPSHGNCLEGLASGPAIEKRMGRKSETISPDDPFWDIEAYYLAQSAWTASLFLAPEVIVCGGGVSNVPDLLPKIRREFEKLNNQYIQTPPLEDYIVSPKLENKAATIGCFELAKKEQ